MTIRTVLPTKLQTTPELIVIVFYPKQDKSAEYIVKILILLLGAKMLFQPWVQKPAFTKE